MTRKERKNRLRRILDTVNGFLNDARVRKIVGLFLLVLSVFLFASFISYLIDGQIDQDKIGKFSNEIENVGGSLGNNLAHQFLYNWFGVSSFLIPFMMLLIGLKWAFEKQLLGIGKSFINSLFVIFWTSICMGFFTEPSILSGVFGYQMNIWLGTLLGKIGTGLLLFFSLSAYIVAKFNPRFFQKKKLENVEVSEEDTTEIPEDDSIESSTLYKDELIEEDELEKITLKSNEEELPQISDAHKEPDEPNLDLEVNQSQQEEILSQKEINTKLEDLGDYDTTLDLSRYKIPSVKLLNDYGSGKIEIDKDELEANKNRIVETLGNYKIGISSITATVGPTITLYEIVPEAGIRISKIKNLEDDIALSLSALGIRIIAPIPGRGTIGIEVPNQNPATVSMKAVLSSEKFQKAEMELPIALGKTISNETFVTDLAKMPHLLMAGATGQGKSVGLNAILASLLYKKHPAQVKFVLVDPKKVELTLFNKIERHFLAKLPDAEEAIITDTKKVINTLYSLCIEMDQRYDLLQKAQCRNIVEYNKKFIARKLNPNDDHRYLPYIVLVIDEFADLIMTAGKEVETPIARLAQLARAIGIHLIVATQRPSVNVITGIIKANFPARIAFRVTSKIDSRTILDAGGADQLIGRGDMLIALGSELTRIQCAFIDTPEVEKVTDFIGNQRAYPEAFMLPEYVGDSEGGNPIADLDDKDVMFEDAARVIVMHQSGSTSLIQRKLKLGYNRAGRIIDQLEAAGIVGPFE